MIVAFHKPKESYGKLLGRKVTWKEVENMVEKLAAKLKDGKFDAIIAVSKGGWIPSRLLADRLKVEKLVSVGISKYREFTEPGEISIYQDAPRIAKGNVLLVDDIVDSGETIERALKHLSSRVHQVTVATLFSKPWRLKIGCTHYFVDETKDWIVFPWETEESK